MMMRDSCDRSKSSQKPDVNTMKKWNGEEVTEMIIAASRQREIMGITQQDLHGVGYEKGYGIDSQTGEGISSLEKRFSNKKNPPPECVPSFGKVK